VPPESEQGTIADFLDGQSQDIQILISKSNLLKNLLQEYRQTLITQAVTRGLDPNVPMKDSGIPWLGTVPKHWRVVLLKHLTTKIGSGKTPRGGSEVYVDDGIMLIRSMNVHDSGLKLDDVVYIPPEVDQAMAATRVKPNDVLLNITGASIGRTCLVPPGLPQANVNQHVCIVRPKFGVLPEYLMYALQSACVRAQIRATENGASREGLNFQQVGSLVISLPENSLDEQRDIVEFLRRKTRSIDATINQIEQQIRLIGVYRQALITAAVTGKIDVRQEVQEHAG